MSKIHFPRNIKQREIAKALPTPEQLDKMEEPKILGLIYRAVFYCVSVLLDIRQNTDPNKYKVDNPVIKDSDLPTLKGNRK